MPTQTLTNIIAALCQVEASGLVSLPGCDDLKAAYPVLKRTLPSGGWPCTMHYPVKGDMRSITVNNNAIGTSSPQPVRKRIHYINTVLIIGKANDQGAGTDALQAQMQLYIDYYDTVIQANRTLKSTVLDVLCGGYSSLRYTADDGDYLGLVFHLSCEARVPVIVKP